MRAGGGFLGQDEQDFFGLTGGEMGFGVRCSRHGEVDGG